MKEKAGQQPGATKEKANPFLEMTQQAVKNCEQALQNGLKLQEESGKWWEHTLRQAGATQDWQKRYSDISAMMGGFMPAAQKRAEELLELAEKNARTGVELTNKAAAAMQTPVLADSQAKWLEFWTDSVGAAQSASMSLVQIGGRTLDAWVDFIQKNTELSQFRAAKA